MNHEETDIDLIERRIKGDLSEKELLEFDRRVTTDLRFAEKVDDYMAIISGIKSFHASEIREEVELWEKEIREEENTVEVIPFPLPWKKYLAVAATVVLLVVAYLFLMNPAQDNASLFASYFTPYSDVITLRDDNTADESLTLAMEFYNEEKYREAIPYFKEYLLEYQDNAEALFYLGNSYLADRRTAEAIPIFEKLRGQTGSYMDHATWYLALAHVLQGEVSIAKELLRQITNDEQHDLREAASDLLDDLP